MFNYAVILIALGAAVGLYMAVQHFRGRTPPRGIVALAKEYQQNAFRVEVAGDEMFFQTISRSGTTVDSGVIRRVAAGGTM